MPKLPKVTRYTFECVCRDGCADDDPDENRFRFRFVLSLGDSIVVVVAHFGFYLFGGRLI